MKKLNRVCFLTPEGISKDQIIEIVLSVLESGIRWIQYRDKSNTKKTIYENALTIRKITKDFDAILSINDYCDIALAADADGVHIGQDDLPLKEAKKIMGNKIIGISTHSILEASEAYHGEADYIGFGPIFHTKTKDAGHPKGLNELKKVVESIKIPILAIGGINANNVSSVLEQGCYGIAISSGLTEGDIRENTKKLLAIFKDY